MRYSPTWVLGATLAIASNMSFGHPAIARPAANSPLPNHLPLNRLSRDLIPSAAADFFNRGRVQLERELQQLATNRPPADKLLKVAPDPRPLPGELEKRQLGEAREQG